MRYGSLFVFHIVWSLTSEQHSISMVLQNRLLVASCDPPKHYELFTQPLPHFSTWMDKQVVKKAESRINNKQQRQTTTTKRQTKDKQKQQQQRETDNQATKWYGKILNANCQLKEADLRILNSKIPTVCSSGKGKVVESGSTSLVARCLEKGPW